MLTLGPQLHTLAMPDLPFSRTELVLMTFASAQTNVFAFLLCLLAADEAVARGAARPGAYALGAVAGSLLATMLEWLPFHYVWSPRFGWAGEGWTAIVWPSMFMGGLVLGGGATILYANLQQARDSRAKLNLAELRRAEVTRRTLGARLAAMQARVEPRFLFDTLAQVKRRYESDPTRAGAMLDGLIAYLRAAMPQMRHPSSTVGREAELARAYLDVMALRAGRGLVFDIEIADGVGAATMPPMLLLPLVEMAIAVPEDGDDRIVGIHVAAADGRVRLSVRDTGWAFDPDRGVERVGTLRERLLAHYGTSASLELRRRPSHGTEAVMEMPHETTEGSDR
jgi:hypothetical protein